MDNKRSYENENERGSLDVRERREGKVFELILFWFPPHQLAGAGAAGEGEAATAKFIKREYITLLSLPSSFFFFFFFIL